MLKKITLFAFLAIFLFSFELVLSGWTSASETDPTTLTPGVVSGMEGVVEAAPTVSPAAGDYHATQTVSLTASGATKICYTTDGSTEPSCASATTCTAGTALASGGTVSVSSATTIKSAGCYPKVSDFTGPVATSAYTFSCTTASVSNGTVSAYPTCAVSCNSGYTLSGSSCVSSGGGGGPSGGGGSAIATLGLVSVPTTATGQVTATAAGGGKTTLTTTDNATAMVQLPVNAVSANTVVTITQVAKTASAVASEMAAMPATKSLVGNSIYSFSAMSGTTNVTTFNQSITLTFTYTDAQIAGLSESSLTVYYWNTVTSAWTALTTTVNASTNTLTAVTNHFTSFAIFGSQGQDIPEGALIRAIGDIDVYIVKYIGAKQFKRLILSPSVFNSYQHLKWGDVRDLDKSVVDSFTTSELVRAVGDTKVYKLYPAGDTGQKRWIKTAEGFNRMGFDWDAIYEINAVDRDSYVTGANIE